MTGGAIFWPSSRNQRVGRLTLTTGTIAVATHHKLLGFAFNTREAETIHRVDMLNALRERRTIRRSVYELLETIYFHAGADRGDRIETTISALADTLTRDRKTVRSAVADAVADGFLIVVGESTPRHPSRVFQIDWIGIYEAVYGRAPREEQTVESPESSRDTVGKSAGSSPRVSRTHPYMVSNEKHVGNVDRLKQGGGWGRRLTSDDLRSRDRVNTLWRHAVSRRWIKDTERNRLGFFACAAQARAGKKPGALFTHLVKTQAWLQTGRISEESDERARRALVVLDRECRESERKKPAAAVSAVADFLDVDADASQLKG